MCRPRSVYLAESNFLWRWCLPPVIEMCNRRELVYLIVWLQRFTYACYHWFWRCRGHTGRSSWCWWLATKRRELKGCCCCPSYVPHVSWLSFNFIGDAKCLPSVSCGSFCASALEKCWLQTWWWSLMTTSWRPSASIYRWGKWCTDTLLSFTRVFPQTMHVSPGIMATPSTLQLNKVTRFFHRKYQTRALNWFAIVLLGKTVQLASVWISNLPVLSRLQWKSTQRCPRNVLRMWRHVQF